MFIYFINSYINIIKPKKKTKKITVCQTVWFIELHIPSYFRTVSTIRCRSGQLSAIM